MGWIGLSEPSTSGGIDMTTNNIHSTVHMQSIGLRIPAPVELERADMRELWQYFKALPADRLPGAIEAFTHRVNRAKQQHAWLRDVYQTEGNHD